MVYKVLNTIFCINVFMYKAVNISVYCTRWKGTQCESKSAKYSLNTKHHYRG